RRGGGHGGVVEAGDRERYSAAPLGSFPMSSSESTGLTYSGAGVEASHEELSLLGRWIAKTFDLNAARPVLPLGYFANVIPLGPDLGLAISTDGVGTKILIAQ